MLSSGLTPCCIHAISEPSCVSSSICRSGEQRQRSWTIWATNLGLRLRLYGCMTQSMCTFMYDIPATSYVNLTAAEQHCAHIFYNKFHPNRTENMDSIGRNSFRPLNKVKRNETHTWWTTFCKELLYQILLKLDKLLSHQCVRYSHLLWLHGSEIEAWWNTRISAPVQTGPRAHPTSYAVSTGCLSRGQSGRGYTSTPLLGCSWPVLRWTLPLPLLGHG